MLSAQSALMISLQQEVLHSRDFSINAFSWNSPFPPLHIQPKAARATLADLLFDIIHLKNNTGNLPPQFVQFIDE
jgi:hypothetical protein